MSRLQNTIRNSSVSMLCQLSTSLLSFINRTFFIYFLNATYLGVNGLFSNILSMLSLAELGLGTAITYKLYKPLAENDKKEIKALMNFYKSVYQIIGATVLALGLCLIPFLDIIVGEHEEIPYFILLYVLYLLNSVSSYFFTYKRSLLSADQKEYLNSVNRLIFAVLQNIGQFLVLLLTRQFVLYLVVTIMCTVLSNIRISFECDRMYPYLKKNTEHLQSDEKKSLFKYVFAQTCHKIGGVVVNGTDNILITTLVSDGLLNVGLLSNYNLILGVLKSFINSIFNSAVASVGNLNASESSQKSKDVFNQMFFINYLFYGFTAVCFFNLAQSFITLWVGKDYLLGNVIVFIVVLNYYLSGMRQTCIVYNTTLGLFWNDRYKPLFEAAINLVASIVLIKWFGMVGVFLGTTVSNLTTNFWVEPYLLYKYGFQCKLVDYFKRYLLYTTTTIAAGICSRFICSFNQSLGWVGFVIKAFICATVTGCLLVGPFFLSKEFEAIKSLLIFHRKRKKHLVSCHQQKETGESDEE